MPVSPNPLLDLVPGVGQVASMVRFQILNRDLDEIGTIVPVQAGSITAKTSGNMKRTLSNVTFDAHAIRELNVFTDRLKPYWVLEDGSEWPLGVFVFTAAVTHVGSYVSTLEVTLADQDFILDQQTRSTFQVVAGGSVIDSIVELLAQIRLTTYQIPIGATTQVGSSNTWPAGTSRLKILTDICSGAGWLPPYFDNVGVLHIRPPPVLGFNAPDHVYSSVDPRVKSSTITDTQNLLSAPNVYIVTDTGPTTGEITAEARVNPNLPYSVENRRFEIVDVTRSNGGYKDTAAAQIAANTKAAAAANAYQTIEFEGTPDPRHDLFDVVEWNGMQYRETGWSLELKSGGSHKHTIANGGFENVG